MLEHMYFPHDISTFGPKIDLLFEIIFWLVMVVWIAVMAAMVTFMVRYRTRPGRKAEYIEGNSRLEIIWTTATTVILITLAFMSRSTWADIKEHGPPGDVFYQVTGKQFNWEITYPGPDGKFGTKDDLLMENELHVPVNKVVRIDLDVQGRHPQFLRSQHASAARRRAGPHHSRLVRGDRDRAIRNSVLAAVRLRAFGDAGQSDSAVARGFRQVAQRPIFAKQVKPAFAGNAARRS